MFRNRRGIVWNHPEKLPHGKPGAVSWKTAPTSPGSPFHRETHLERDLP